MYQRRPIEPVISNDNPIIEPDLTDCSDPKCGICNFNGIGYGWKLDYASHQPKLKKAFLSILELTMRGA